MKCEHCGDTMIMSKPWSGLVCPRIHALKERRAAEGDFRPVTHEDVDREAIEFTGPDEPTRRQWVAKPAETRLAGTVDEAERVLATLPVTRMSWRERHATIVVVAAYMNGEIDELRTATILSCRITDLPRRK